MNNQTKHRRDKPAYIAMRHQRRYRWKGKEYTRKVGRPARNR